MPVSTNSRYEPPLSPPSMISTPSRSSYYRSQNNSTSYTPTITSGGIAQQKLNVVTRVAIEGKAKQGQDGASVKMFLKICVPLDLVTPGSTIPLFPEENVKIHTSQVHPLDHNGVPYNFSSTVFPLLHNAARALSLPQRSHEDFNTVVGSSNVNGTSTSNRSQHVEIGDKAAPIDAQYTGHILVSGYSISFVLPRIFLPRRKDFSQLDTGGTPASRRRPSIGERNQALFMAVIDMWVPFLGKPPRSPYLLSIPTPRCLQNYIRLRIFPPPVNNSSSFASLSSMEDENAAWDLTSEPHVTRTLSKPSRSSSYNNFADDESSDSSVPLTTDACVIQGSFPSAERIRIRWAKPTKYLDIPGDESGRRRVGVEESKGEMTCTIRGKGTSAGNPQAEGVLMHVEYKGHCQGIWFAGVATLLGLDVGLEAKGSDVSWPDGYPSRWEVSGATGFTGFGTGSSSEPSTINSRTISSDSTDSRHKPLLSSPNGLIQDSAPGFLNAKTDSSASSLLRAPLPMSTVGEYSFEGSAATLNLSPSEISSVASMTTPSHPTSSQSVLKPVHPGSPITLHLNMNELQAPTKNMFTFTISGTILITSRTVLARLNGPIHGKSTELEPIVLPRFTVLAADTESTSILIRNEVDGACVEVFNPTGDIQHDPQTRKTVLQKNAFTKCTEDGARIALKFFDTLYPGNVNNSRPHARPRTPSNNMSHLSSNSSNPRKTHLTRSKPDGPCIIPSVKVTVTALAPDINNLPTGYAVRVILQTPLLVDSEWLHFGIAHGLPDTDHIANSGETNFDGKVHTICASLDGVPVRSETTKLAQVATDVTAGAAPFEELSGKEWICWVKVHTGSSIGGTLVIDYIVKEAHVSSGNYSRNLKDVSALEILLPTFFVSIARLEVYVDLIPGLDISSLRSNFDYHYALPDGNRLLRYSVNEYNKPQLLLMVRKSMAKQGPLRQHWYFITTWSILLVVFCLLYQLMADVHRLQRISVGYFGKIESWSNIPVVTVTSTVYASTSTRYHGEPPIETPDVISRVAPTSAEPPPNLNPISTQLANDVIITTTQMTQKSHDDTSDSYPKNSVPPSTPEAYGLLPVENNFSFEWVKGGAFKHVLQELVATMEVVWDVFRKVYHYPLDPP